MRRVLAFLAALLGVASGTPAVADAPAETQGQEQRQWSRIATPDGRIAASFPCSAKDRKEIGQGSVYAADCNYRGLEYIAQLGGGLLQDKVGGYAEVLASARKDPTSGQIIEKTIAGHRAFTAIRPAKDGVGYGLFLDYGPGSLVTLLAYENDGETKLSGTARDAAMADAQRFIGSLEVLPK